MGETLERWLDVKAMARRLCSTDSMVWRFTKQGKLPEPSYHLGPRSARWDAFAVDAAMVNASGLARSETTTMMVQRACEEIERDAARRKDRQKAARRRLG